MNGKRILIVDDDPVCLKNLARTLYTAGYEVLLAQDGAGAVSTARERQPDLIILDNRFPPEPLGGVAWDGILVLEWLRRLPETRRIPVILASEDLSVTARDRARAAGFFGYFPKPIDTVGLLNVLYQKLMPSVTDSEAEPGWQEIAA